MCFQGTYFKSKSVNGFKNRGGLELSLLWFNLSIKYVFNGPYHFVITSLGDLA